MHALLSAKNRLMVSLGRGKKKVMPFKQKKKKSTFEQKLQVFLGSRKDERSKEELNVDGL